MYSTANRVSPVGRVFYLRKGQLHLCNKRPDACTVLLYGGTISVSSSPGEGTSFSVELPQHLEAESVSSMEWKARILFLHNQFCESRQLIQKPMAIVNVSSGWGQFLRTIF